jgi:hypothetical protein
MVEQLQVVVADLDAGQHAPELFVVMDQAVVLGGLGEATALLGEVPQLLLPLGDGGYLQEDVLLEELTLTLYLTYLRLQCCHSIVTFLGVTHQPVDLLALLPLPLAVPLDLLL